jgi:hypothetical protein
MTKQILKFLQIIYNSLIKDITTGADTEETGHNLETLHDSVHDYIGGDMGVVENSAYDPIFWFHHAFIDYIWESYRGHQTAK